jgi:hypothetical protein
MVKSSLNLEPNEETPPPRNQPRQRMIKASQTTQLPPLCEQLVLAEVIGKIRLNVTFVVQGPRTPIRGKPKVARSITQMKDSRILLVLANLTDQPMLIQAGQTLAVATRCDNPHTIKLKPLHEDHRTICLMLQNLKIKHPEINITELPGEIEVNEELTKDQILRLTKLIHKFKDVFNTSGTNPGQVDPQIAVHKIDTADNPPIAHMPYRLTPERRQIVSKMVKDMLEAGIISKSRSPWSSPVVLVPKANGKLRFCVDIRNVNEATIKGIDDPLESLEGAKYFTAFDLASGYWQVPMKQESKKKTAFITHEGLYEFNVMPFGLVNATATFQRMMNNIISNLQWQSAMVYLDDIIVYSKTFVWRLPPEPITGGSRMLQKVIYLS